jgi:hypothetical protein
MPNTFNGVADNREKDAKSLFAAKLHELRTLRGLSQEELPLAE